MYVGRRHARPARSRGRCQARARPAGPPTSPVPPPAACRRARSPAPPAAAACRRRHRPRIARELCTAATIAPSPRTARPFDVRARDDGAAVRLDDVDEHVVHRAPASATCSRRSPSRRRCAGGAEHHARGEIARRARVGVDGGERAGEAAQALVGDVSSIHPPYVWSPRRVGLGAADRRHQRQQRELAASGNSCVGITSYGFAPSEAKRSPIGPVAAGRRCVAEAALRDVEAPQESAEQARVRTVDGVRAVVQRVALLLVACTRGRRAGCLSRARSPACPAFASSAPVVRPATPAPMITTSLFMMHLLHSRD